MENRQQNKMDQSSNTNPNPTGNTQDSNSSGSTLSSLPQNPVYGGIGTGIMTPQMFQNNNGIFAAQNLPQDSGSASALSPRPGMIHPFLEFVPNHGGTITPSIASSYNSNPSTNTHFNAANAAANTSTDLKAVTATMQSTAASGVIVPGVGISRGKANGKKGGSLTGDGGRSPKRQRRISSVAAAATSALAAAPGPTQTTTLGGVTIPSIHPQASTALQVQIAAAAAAAEAAPLKPKGGNAHTTMKTKSSELNSDLIKNKDGLATELSSEEKAKINRDRNREHARSTRLRKKAYVNKLKELVEGLHAERTEETKKNRVAIQHLSEVQAVRKSVMRTFLKYLANFEGDERNWSTLMEDDFWLKQPITPYRSFPRYEIENECRKTRGIDGMITESASMSVMIEGIGSRSERWMHIKREEFLSRQDNTPLTVMGQNGIQQHAVSSLSSSSGSSNGNVSGNEEDLNHHRKMGSSVRNNGKAKTISKQMLSVGNPTSKANKVSSGSSGSEYRNETSNNTSNEYHIYNAPSLPDPMLSGESCGGSESTNDIKGSQNSSNCTDSSSTDEENKQPAITTTRAKNKDVSKTENASLTQTESSSTNQPNESSIETSQNAKTTRLPPNIAKKGGISHNIRPVTTALVTKSQILKNVNDRLKVSPVTPLPPFLGLGKKPLMNKTTPEKSINSSGPTPKPVLSSKRKQVIPISKPNGGLLHGKVQNKIGLGSEAPIMSAVAPLISPVAGTDTSSSSTRSVHQIKAQFHVNEDDMLITDDVLMCPFVLRSQEAVLCGALAECIMSGMLRASFSSRNKLLDLEMIYDAMGFMQQLERASGREGTAQIIPNSLDMALVPIAEEPRVITLAKPPFLIVSVNEAWTKMTKYTQMDAEGKELKILQGKRTDSSAGIRAGKPCHDFAHVANGRCACSVNRLYNKCGAEYIEFSCSYPLSK